MKVNNAEQCHLYHISTLKSCGIAAQVVEDDKGRRNLVRRGEVLDADENAGAVLVEFFKWFSSNVLYDCDYSEYQCS